MDRSEFAVLRLSRLPPFFGEQELKDYLLQFGEVAGIHMPKSRKTLKPHGYAFVKVHREIAQILCATLDGVLNFNKIMKCEIVSNPKWSVFRRKPQFKSSRELESNRQLRSALHRNRPRSVASTNAKNPALRRRARSFQKRVDALKSLHPAFKFRMS